MLAAALYLVLAAVLLALFGCVKPNHFPPGPRWLPVLGSLAAVQALKSKHGYYYLAFQELARRFGPILGLKLGKQRFVVLSSHDLIRKALLRDEFNGRPDGFFFRFRSFGKEKGVLFTEGQIWTQHRRFTMRHLRQFGLGRTRMNDQIEMEAHCLVEFLGKQSQAGRPVMMHTAFDIAVLNSLWVMFAGHRFDYEDAKVKSILDTVHEVFRISDSLGGIMSHMPFLRFVIPELSGFNNLRSTHKRLWAFLGDEIASHEATLHQQQEPRDLIDAFLMEIASRRNSNPDAKSQDENNNNINNKYDNNNNNNNSNDESNDEAASRAETETIFDRENLLILCLDLFLAGSKTTTDTLATIFAYLALHPQHVRELQAEMQESIGRDRPPRISDAAQLPKVEAFLAEAQRYLVLAPLGVPHKTTRDTELDGYHIPKDTIVLMNFFSAHNDENHWDDPHEFRPQRFLDESGAFRQHSAFMPFGAGKRRCLGEIIARSSLFLLFTHVLHYFDLEPSPEHGKPDTRGYDGFTISPKPYYLKLRTRDDLKA